MICHQQIKRLHCYLILTNMPRCFVNSVYKFQIKGFPGKKRGIHLINQRHYGLFRLPVFFFGSSIILVNKFQWLGMLNLPLS